jgi:hypothetical protein
MGDVGGGRLFRTVDAIDDTGPHGCNLEPRRVCDACRVALPTA